MVIARPVDNAALNHLRFRRLPDGDVLATTDTGDWAVLTAEQFDDLLHGRIPADSDLHRALDEKNFFVHDEMLKRSYAACQDRTAFMRQGPNLHIMVVTLRCNYNCVYCHASKRGMRQTQFDMSIETAKQVVDFIFSTTNQAVNIEFQGGEPLANWETVRFVIDYAREKNRTEKKSLAFSLVSNLSLMDEDKLKVLIAEDIYLCTSIDGPPDLHDRNRPFTGGDSYAATAGWLKRIEEEYAAAGMDPRTHHVDVLLTVSRATLSRGREVVDEYVKLGRNTLHLRPLNPFGFGKSAWESIGYTTQEFLAFYRDTLDYIISLNRSGVELIERQAGIILTRILTSADPNYMELRSPCGATLGQVAYNYNGDIFTCDEARMLYEMGDDIFLLGRAGETTYDEAMSHPTTKGLVMASCQDALPYCSTCAYKPFCGVCPVYNYAEQGDIFGRMPGNQRCALLMGQFETYFALLRDADEGLKAIFERWITRRSRENPGFFGPR